MNEEFEQQMQYLLDQGVKIDDLFKQRIKRQYLKIKNKGIKQIDPKTKEVIAIYPNATEAYFATAIDPTTIHKCLRDGTGRRRTAGGFLWEYKLE